MTTISSQDASFIESFVPPPLRLLIGAGKNADDGHLALLWLDIVESSRIGRKLVEAGPTGIETLATLLNVHFDRLLTALIAHGGEPMMFAGDAILAGWRCTPETMSDGVARAIACAETVLATPGLELPWGERIALHVAVAAGPCRSAEIGGDQEQLFVTVGAGLADLQATLLARAPSRILLSAAAQQALGPACRSEPAGPTAAILTVAPCAPAIRALAIPPLPSSARERLAAHVPLPVMGLRRGLMAWALEQRQLTVIFARLADLDHAAPDILDRLAEMVGIVAPIVRAEGGFLHEVSVDDQGTQLRVYFGTPSSMHADSAARAVRTAMALRGALRARDYRISLGVATGFAVSGLVGNDVFRGYEIFGGIIGRAARLQALPQGMVQCDAATEQAARGSIDFLPIGQTALRGISPAAEIWTPRSDGRPEAITRMHGRAAELAQLLDGLADCQAGGTRIVMVEADSGLGKSRLLAELRQRATAAGCLVLGGHADPIERRVPFRAWRGVVASLLDMDAAGIRGAGVTRTLPSLGPDLDAHASLLNAVLPIDLPHSPATRALAPTQRVALLSALLLALLRRSAQQRTTVVTIDDTHWAGEETWQLATAAADVPGLYLVLAMQPLDEARHSAPLEAAGARRIRLEPLGAAEQDSLALARLGADRLSQPLAELLRASARGHPFFCLELAQALMDERLVGVVDGTAHLLQDAVPKALKLPQTLRAAVIRRIDRLEPESQITLKVASAAGLRFPTKLVVDVHPTRPDDHVTIGGHLTLHHRIGLLAPEAVEDLDGYAFHHGALRDVAYDLMLHTQRRPLHREIASWYERAVTTGRSRIYTVLAYHLEAAGDTTRAAEYLQLEAERLFAQGFAAQSVATGLHAARLLGCELPTEAAGIPAAIGAEMAAIATLIGARTPADLAHLPPLADPRVGQTIGLLLTLAPFAHQCEQLGLFALFGCTCLRLTLEHGNGPAAPNVYSMYSVVHGALTGDRGTASAWSRLGLELLGDDRGAQFSRCGFIHAWFHNHWTQSFPSGIEMALACADAGLAGNEIIFSCFSLSAHVVLMAAAGSKLDRVIDTARGHLPRNDRQVVNAHHHLVQELQFAKAMSGRTPALGTLADDEFGTSDIDGVVETGLTNQIGFYFLIRAKLCVFAAEWEAALEWADRSAAIAMFFGGQTAEFELAQYRGLAALAAAAFTTPSERDRLLERGRDCLGAMRAWERRNPVVFAHKADLLDGMLQAALGEHAEARRLLQRASERARAQSFRQDAALASECLARALLQQGADPRLAIEQARSDYADWGAMRKVAMMDAEFDLAALSSAAPQ